MQKKELDRARHETMKSYNILKRELIQNVPPEYKLLHNKGNDTETVLFQANQGRSISPISTAAHSAGTTSPSHQEVLHLPYLPNKHSKPLPKNAFFVLDHLEDLKLSTKSITHKAESLDFSVTDFPNEYLNSDQQQPLPNSPNSSNIRLFPFENDSLENSVADNLDDDAAQTVLLERHESHHSSGERGLCSASYCSDISFKKNHEVRRSSIKEQVSAKVVNILFDLPPARRTKFKAVAKTATLTTPPKLSSHEVEEDVSTLFSTDQDISKRWCGL